MNDRSYDSGELARSLLGELSQADRAALMIEQFQKMNSLEAVVAARNAQSPAVQAYPRLH